MRHTLLILSHLLRYPSEAMQQAAPELVATLERDGVLESGQIEEVKPLVQSLIDDDLLDLQEGYSSLFDRGRALSLHMFEHVHGESRDRGQAMVDLRDRYEAQGLEIAAHELPDYLPLFLEYLSVLPTEQALTELSQPGVVIAALAQRLGEKGTPWAAPMQVLSELAGASADELAIVPPDDPDDLAALDKAWAEEQVRFDAPAAPDAACPQAAAMVARFGSPNLSRSEVHG